MEISLKQCSTTMQIKIQLLSDNRIFSTKLISPDSTNSRYMRIKFFRKILLVAIFSNHLFGLGQVAITGPSCVIPGTIYLYDINATWDSASKMQVCLLGGRIAGSALNCTLKSNPQSFVQVMWDSGSTGSIQVSSSKGNTTINVSITTPLKGGTISDSAKSQVINYDSLASVINCSPGSGGSCSPHYSYQWEESIDMFNWADVPGATGQNLTPPKAFTQTTFIRRKIIETTSGTRGYSNVATINVGAAPPTSNRYNKMRINADGELAYNSTRIKTF